MADSRGPEQHERAVSFQCRDAELLGILHPADAAADVLVIVVVGGHQYRIGSHRQFVQLARALARAGIPAMRFDHRGYGDSGGELHRYWSIGPDIAAAIDAGTLATGASQVILWGLCDGASAICFYAPEDSRVAGIVLANPWVRSEHTQTQAYLWSYYPQRLKQLDFWRSLVGGRIDLRKAGHTLSRIFRRRTGSGSPTAATGTAEPDDTSPTNLPAAVMHDLDRFDGSILILLSGDDITASEFRYAASTSHWRRRLRRKGKRLTTRTFDGADHTFARNGAKAQVEQDTVAWIHDTFALANAGSPDSNIDAVWPTKADKRS